MEQREYQRGLAKKVLPILNTARSLSRLLITQVRLPEGGSFLPSMTRSDPCERYGLALFPYRQAVLSSIHS